MTNNLHIAINKLYENPLTNEELAEASSNIIAFVQELISIDLEIKKKEKNQKC